MADLLFRSLQQSIQYSEKYADDVYEYRHVILPSYLLCQLEPAYREGRLLTETEWRNLGVTQSHGWEHYLVRHSEPHVLLFRREKNYAEKYGNLPPRRPVFQVRSS